MYKTNHLEDGFCLKEHIIGFEWILVNHSSWQTRYDELIIFKQQHGHCNEPQRYEQNKPLGLWVHRQRRQYRLKCKD